MKKNHIIKLLLLSVTLGILIDITWVRYQAKKRSVETVSYLTESMDKILTQVDNQLTSLSNIYYPCSNESRKKLEEMVFNSSILKEVTYIENGQFQCGDRNSVPLIPLNSQHLEFITDNDNYVIYRSRSQRRDIDGVFFMIPVNNGWFRVLFDINFIDFWVNQLTEKQYLYGCMLDNQNDLSYRCEQNQTSRILFSRSLHSKNYPFSVVSGYTNEMLINIYLHQLPYATLIILSLSGLLTLLGHAFFNWRTSLHIDIQRGIDRREFVGFYQPIVNSQSGEWLGAELLVRWLQPNNKIISPAEFIPTAEQSGQINKITLQLLERAASEKEKINSISPDCYLSINVTASMIANESYVDSLIEMINTHHSLQTNVTLEFTERETFANIEISALQTGMQKLREVGVRWALDDFGTGYAGLSTLQALSFDILKIDRTFVASSVTDAVTHSIIGNIAQMGHKLQCSLVAEGVETIEQAKRVAQLGIQSSQGFYFDRPMPFEDFFTKLESMLYHNQSSAPQVHIEYNN